MMNHQNLWNSLVINPISKFGVLFSRFYINVDGKKCELRTANTGHHVVRRGVVWSGGALLRAARAGE